MVFEVDVSKISLADREYRYGARGRSVFIEDPATGELLLRPGGRERIERALSKAAAEIAALAVAEPAGRS